MDNLELISGLRWYFEMKNISLKNVLCFRCPLSVQEQQHNIFMDCYQ